MVTATDSLSSDVKRGFPNVPCIKCREVGCVSTDLDDLSCFYCSSCDEEFDAADVVALVQEWTAVLEWIATAPEVK